MPQASRWLHTQVPSTSTIPSQRHTLNVASRQAVLKLMNEKQNAKAQQQPTIKFKETPFERDYVLGEQLGSGQFATVHKCQHRLTGVAYAAKLIAKRRVANSRRGVLRADIEREVTVLTVLDGQSNIVKLHDVYERSLDIILILELVIGGELFDHVFEKMYLSERETRHYVRHILTAVKHMHANHVVHLDLKPENVLVGSEPPNDVKVIDFGLSRVIHPGDIVCEMIGTPEFVAPEIVNYEPLSTATDMWSIGVIAYILLTGVSPFMSERGNRQETFANITSVRYTFDAQLFEHVTPLAQDFIRNLLRRRPRDRLTCHECLSHPWLSDRPRIHSVESNAKGPPPPPRALDLEVSNNGGDDSMDSGHGSDGNGNHNGPTSSNHVEQVDLGDTTPTPTLPNETNNNMPFLMGDNHGGDNVSIASDVEECKSAAARRRWLRACSAIIICRRVAVDWLKTGQRRPMGIARTPIKCAVHKHPICAQDNTHGNLDLQHAILCASEVGNIDALQQLDEVAEFDLDKPNDIGETAMHCAAGGAQHDLIKYLSAKGAKLDQADAHGDTPLHWASRHGHTTVVQHLCDNIPDVDVANQCGETALHLAVKYGHHSVVFALTNAGANVNAGEGHGDTALHLAANHGHSIIMQLLCHSSRRANLMAVNHDEETALQCASARSHMDCARHLLHPSDSVDVASTSSDPTNMSTLPHDDDPLSMSQHVNMQDKNGRTALHFACERGHVDMALLLLCENADVNLTDANGNTALHIAARNALTKAVSELCGHGVNIDATNLASLSALHLAAREGHIECVRALCVAGADITISNKDDQNAETIAIISSRDACAALLKTLRTTKSLQRTCIDQLTMADAPLKRIKLKLFGDSAAGKTRLIQAMQQNSAIGGIFSGITRRFSESSQHSKSDHHSSRESLQSSSESNVSDRPPKCAPPNHSAYTRGIKVDSINIPTVGGCSVWEFSGYQQYHQVFDHFVGNTSCAHIIVFDASQSTELQYAQVQYWLNVLCTRMVEQEPIGHCGVLAERSYVVLVGTRADLIVSQEVNSARQDKDQTLVTTDGQAMLDTLRLRYAQHCRLHDALIYVDTQAGHSCAGMKSLRRYLHQTRESILNTMQRAMPLVDIVLEQLTADATNVPPIMSWASFINYVRHNCNPLAQESHCKLLIQQLQLQGDVVYLKNEQTDSDYVVLNVDWLCHYVIGTLLSYDTLIKARSNGTYDDFQLGQLMPDVPLETLTNIMSTLQLGAYKDDVDYELTPMFSTRMPAHMWPAVTPSTVIGGMRIHAQRGTHDQLPALFSRVQCALRRSMFEFNDAMNAELLQFHRASLLYSGDLQAYITLVTQLKSSSIQLLVRAASETERVQCFYFMEDLANLIETSIGDVAPGLCLERHFVSSASLKAQEANPTIYTPETIMRMQLSEQITVRNGSDVEEMFTDVVCFGSCQVTQMLQLGIDMSVEQLSITTRRQLAELLDPSDAMGRDWSILAVRLGLTEQLPDVDLSGAQLSRTDQVLAEWALTKPMEATVGRLLRTLLELDRDDCARVVMATVPLYVVSAAEEHELDYEMGGGMVHERSNTQATITDNELTGQTKVQMDSGLGSDDASREVHM